ncbi:unnamed protein product [Protopolystoma xenopodis]|uniref:Uncharacterized protein n=1 Tax=Protopolystoma xenopodis TaxID=117903 RepID=A0A3S4ZYB1_9PLAT|nr:unnamed protein product [Protopolystoma xenopodis]
MTPGLSQHEAFDCQLLFRSEHEQLLRKAESCRRGQVLFGLPTVNLEELKRIGRQLELLQRLYGLYSEVNRTVASYSDTAWRDADLEMVEMQLIDFEAK